MTDLRRDAAVAPADIEELDAGSEPLCEDEAASARLAAIVDSCDDAIVSKSLDGIVKTWNRAAEKMFGWTAEEVIGRSITLIIPPDKLSEEEHVLSKIRRGEMVDHFETLRVRKDGTFIDISLTVSPIRDAFGHVIGASKIARDISERKRLESERTRLLDEAQRANRAKDEFLAMLGHELRNPLSAVTSAAYVLEEIGLSDPRARRACAVIARQSRHMARLVDDLLQSGRLLAGKIVLDSRPIDLGAVVAEHCAQLRAAGIFDDHQVRVETQAVWVAGDPVRLEQIVDNLVGNALKFTPSGGEITIRVAGHGSQALLTVEDRGAGIEPALLPLIFELFVQGQRALDRREGGLGIGLTLVKRLTELHGGTVAAQSPGVGQGSHFEIRLPMIVKPELRVAAPPLPVDSLRKRILIVEDNVDAREMLREVLERVGHVIFEIGDGEQGIESALRIRPDVALIDIGLPLLDGYEVARRIRAEAPEIRLIALTGYGSSSDRARAAEAGFEVHLTKPIDPRELMRVLAKPKR